MAEPDWQQIVSRHGPAVWRTVRYLLGNEHDAADCYQMVFREALQTSRRQRVDNWQRLLVRIARTRALDMLRSRYRHAARIEAGWEPTEARDRAPLPDELLQAAELVELLRVGLAQLTPLQAEVFLMRYVEELTYDEIADRTASNRNAVGTLLNRARERLRTFLNGHYQVESASGEERK